MSSYVKRIVLALGAGIAAFLIGGVTVTEVARPWIEFSLFLGIPTGLALGTVVAAAVSLGLADDAPPRRHRIAVSLAGFGVSFLVTLVVLGGLVNIGAILALVVSFAAGLVAAAVIHLRRPSGREFDGDGSVESD
ncbi:hypothetical protein [Halomontanus rarus]|uniref:hypothetical protein n=1 Tax=Halomontanus rarus TaxID=3034020 RepID=UPI0023E8D2BF|nr:hypothetical protein [Halovivax sp. TS33]